VVAGINSRLISTITISTENPLAPFGGEGQGEGV